jgi:transcriptional regulator with XRE-family HTH domain
MARRATNHFGASARRYLAEAQATQTALATAVGVSASYANQLLTGAKRPSPQWIDLMADAMQMNQAQRRELHRAAALDAGYKLDLTK